ncbi:553_t:CDS:2, partial [Cetraspora pellucida]
ESSPQLQSIVKLNMPESLKFTLSGNLFLIRDQIISDDERMLVFTTTENIKYLSRAVYWIMDGTFQTVPTIFYQLYTVHASVGLQDNSKIFPLVYTLMTAPLFLPQLWSVFDSVEIGIPRTSNVVEGWHYKWATLIGRQHVGIYTFI